MVTEQAVRVRRLKDGHDFPKLEGREESVLGRGHCLSKGTEVGSRELLSKHTCLIRRTLPNPTQGG